MPSLDDFHRTIQATLASKRLGSPVFVRYLVQAPIATTAVSGFLAQIAESAQVWLNQNLDRIYGLGSAAAGHVTLTLECDGGATAQLTWTRGAANATALDLMLVGNQGVLYHDAGMTNSWPIFTKLPADSPPSELVAWIDRTLRSRQPESRLP